LAKWLYGEVKGACGFQETNTSKKKNSSRRNGLKGAQASKHFQTFTQRYHKHMPAAHTVFNADGLVTSRGGGGQKTLNTIKGNKSNGKLLPRETYVNITSEIRMRVLGCQAEFTFQKHEGLNHTAAKPEIADRRVSALLPLSGYLQTGKRAALS
jgi:hypothetical protein